MTSAELLQRLWGPSLAVVVATCVLLVLPRLLRRHFGAGAAYAAWWLLPVALVASLLPARIVETAAVVQPVAVLDSAQPIVAEPVAAADHSLPWLSLWCFGALCMAWRLWRQQRRFEAALGRVRRLDDELWLAESRHGLPALLGALRPRIVLPDDFERRYDPRERGLMLAHERQHLHRGDHLANLAVAAIRCMFWFNPLVHLAAARFRHDQELACDQAVIAAHPDSRRAYGEAMLKTLMADRQAPLGCHWGFSHPLKERVMQLKTPAPRAWARRLGLASVATLTLGAGFAVWSAQPPRAIPSSGDDFVADVGLRIDGAAPERFVIRGDDGQPIAFAHRDDRGRVLDVGATVRRLEGDRYDIAMVLTRDGEPLAKPRLVVARGTPAVVKVGEASAGGAFAGVEVEMEVDGRTQSAPAPLPVPPAVPAPAPPKAPLAPPPLPSASAMPAPPAPPQPATPPAPPAPPALPSAERGRALPAPRAMPVQDADAAHAAAAAAHAEAHAKAHAKAHADALRSAGHGQAAHADAARAFAAAKEAEAVARTAEAAAVQSQRAMLERDRARAEATAAERRAAAMTPEQRTAELAAIRARISERRDELRAMAAAKEAAAVRPPGPAAPGPTPIAAAPEPAAEPAPAPAPTP